MEKILKIGFVKTTANRVIYLQGGQNSGGSVSARGRIYAVRIA